MGYLDIQIEKVSGDIPELFRIGSTGLWSKFKTVKAERVGERGIRMPRLTSIGAQYGAYSSQGGDSIRGRSPGTEYMTSTFVERMLAAELDKRDMEILKGPDEVAKMNVFQRIMSALPDEWGQAMEAELFSNGTPFVFTATAFATVSGVTVYTGDTKVGSRFLRPGVGVTVYDTTGATVKATTYVKTVDVLAKKVELAVTVAGAAATDIIAYGIFTGASPVGLAGIKVWNDNASSGTLYGIDRAVQPEIRATNVAVGGALDQAHVLLGKHKQMARFGKDSMPKGQVGVIPLSVHATILTSMTSIQKSEIFSGPGTNVDRLPHLVAGDDFTWAGGQIFTLNEHQSSDRIDFIDPADFFWCEVMPLDFFKNEAGMRVHTIVGSNGVPISRSWLAMTQSMQLMNPNPRMGLYLTGITIATDYQGF